MNTAQEIANFIIKESLALKAPISNLKLQKLLFFSWIDYYKEKKSFLFKERFYAWQFGPVIPEVYYLYCSYGALPIILLDETSEDDVADEDKKIIMKTVETYKNVPACQLVSKTHETEHVWSRIYQGGSGNRNPIPFEDIIRFECGN